MRHPLYSTTEPHCPMLGYPHGLDSVAQLQSSLVLPPPPFYSQHPIKWRPTDRVSNLRARQLRGRGWRQTNRAGYETSYRAHLLEMSGYTMLSEIWPAGGRFHVVSLFFLHRLLFHRIPLQLVQTHVVSIPTTHTIAHYLTI